ncbi:hypothetical protein H8959_001520 [Pygathrix nigripes]
MFTIGMREAFQKEVELIGASYIGLKAVVDFLYGGELVLDGGNIDYVLETAHLLQIWTVVDFCCEYLEQEVSEDNYLYLQELASIYSLKRLDAFIDGFILNHFGTLSFTPDFLQNVSMQKLCVYLSSSEVQRECEHDLLQAALQWLTQQPEREAHARQVLENIHFPLIPKNDLLHRVKPAVCSLLPKEANCEGFIEEAVRYHNNLAAQPVMQTKRTALRTNQERLLFVGGEVSERCLELSDDTCYLDAKSEQWVKETPLPARRSHHCVAVLGGFIFIAGGSFSRDNGGDAASNLLYRYDPRCKQWIKVASMNQRRVDFYLASIEDMLVAVGGRNENGALSSVETYSPKTDSWSYVAGLPRFTYGHAGTIYKDFVYISGGHDYQIGPYRKNLLCYDHRTDVWEERRPMTTARGWHSMCSLGDSIYSIGGSDDNIESMERFDVLGVEAYSPQCNQWTRVGATAARQQRVGRGGVGGPHLHPGRLQLGEHRLLQDRAGVRPRGRQVEQGRRPAQGHRWWVRLCLRPGAEARGQEEERQRQEAPGPGPVTPAAPPGTILTILSQGSVDQQQLLSIPETLCTT